MKFENESNLTIEESGLSEIDHVTEWISIGDNLWFHDFGFTYWNPPEYVAVGDKFNVCQRADNPAVNMEYNWESGSTEKPSSLTICLDHKPEAWVGMGQKPMILLNDCHDCVVRVSGRYAGTGVRKYTYYY